jgi:uncharacterized phage protein gp47/JayE
VIGGTMAGIYLDQQLLSNDPFPQTARTDALAKHLQTYFQPPLNTFIQPQPAVGNASVTGAVGTIISVGLSFLYQPNGNSYQATSGFVMAATSALVPVESVGTGQIQNLTSGASLFIPSPPAGLNSTASASGDFQDGRDLETPAEAAARILAFIQTPPAGGTTADYVRFCQDADPSVVSVNVLRFPNGFGTVACIITAGTTDIDTALNNGDPIVVTPSPALLAEVLAYVNTVNPITDCVQIYGPYLLPVNVTVTVTYSQGNGSTVLPGQTLTQDQLVIREVQRAIWKTPPGGRQLGASGYMVKSDIEEGIDIALSNEPYQTGTMPILQDRIVADLSATGANLLLLGTQTPVPGVITIIG